MTYTGEVLLVTKKFLISHMASFQGNVGDVASHKAFRTWFQSLFPNIEIQWLEIEIREFYRDTHMGWYIFDEAVSRSDCLIIGGGNFLELWPENSPTGTSLPFSTEKMENFSVPIFLNTKDIEEIIEIGGGAGIDFFTACHYVDCQKAWTIYETKELCEAILSHGISHPRLKFRSGISVLSSEVGFDKKVLYLNSSIQYLPNPVEQLRFLLELGPKKIGMIRTPLCQIGREFEYRQESRLADNGPQVSLRPQVDAVVKVNVRILPVFVIRELFQEHGYRIVLEESAASNFGISSRWSRSDVKNYLFLAEKL